MVSGCLCGSASLQYSEHCLTVIYLTGDSRPPPGHVGFELATLNTLVPLVQLSECLGVYLYRDNNTTAMQKRSSLIVNSPLADQYGSSSVVSLFLSGHLPWQYSMRVENVESERCA